MSTVENGGITAKAGKVWAGKGKIAHVGGLVFVGVGAYIFQVPRHLFQPVRFFLHPQMRRAELLYYFLSFSAGAYLFGGKQISQLTLLLIGVLVLLVRIVLADTTYFYEYWIPIAFLSYFILRLPFNSESFREHLKDYNISNIIGKS